MTAALIHRAPVLGVFASAAGPVAFLVPLAIYVASMSHNVSAWDTAEAQTTPWILGIMHPTGFPLYTLLGWAFAHAMPFGTVAWRLNLFTALATALACLVVRDLARRFGAGPAAALGAALVYAVTPPVWRHAIHADVHPLAILFALGSLDAAIAYLAERRARTLVVACAAYGLALAVHPTALWFGLPVAYLLVDALRRRNPRLALAGFAAATVPLAFYLYLPLRSLAIAHANVDPLLGAPFNGMGEIVWDVNHPHTIDGFFREVLGTDFGASGRLAAIFDVAAYPRDFAFWRDALAEQFGVFTMTALCLLAAMRLLARHRRGPFLALACALAPVPFTVAYANTESDTVRYLITSFAVLLALAAASPALFAEALERERFGRIPAACFPLLALMLVHDGDATFAYRNEGGGNESIAAVQREIPDGAIVVVGWIDATSLAYAQFVDGSLGTRILVGGWPGDYVPYYAAWRKERRVFLFLDDHMYPNLREIPRGMAEERFTAVPGHHLLEIVR